MSFKMQALKRRLGMMRKRRDDEEKAMKRKKKNLMMTKSLIRERKKGPIKGQRLSRSRVLTPLFQLSPC